MDLRTLRTGALLALLPLLATPLTAQEHKELGRMWTFEHVPVDWFEEAYGFRPTPDWLEHVRLASLRFGSGCSASFVSPDGLILTNHHCARESIAKVSPPDEDWLADGFFATDRDEEVEVPGLTVQQLVATADITDRMNAGIEEGDDAATRKEKLEANWAEIEADARERHPDLQHQRVSLYQGGNYQLYSYRIYDDIRLVCAPTLQAQKFGGDPDNFTYPRYALDFAVLRAYEDDQPVDTTDHYLRFRTAGPEEGELVFVTGNPGSTGRLNTVAQMEYLRDVRYPRLIQRLEAGLETMRQRAEADEATAKQLRNRILSFENALKAYRGYLDGLRNEEIMEKKRAAEAAIRKAIAADPELAGDYGNAWKDLEGIVARKREGKEVSEDEEEAATKRIGEAYFAVYGTEIAPDATFTLRLSDGVVKGFPYNGTVAPWKTTLYGLFERHANFDGAPPFHLDPVWKKKEDELDLTTPVNLVATCDIIGGNSGSPLIDQDKNLVGLVFDGNIEMLGNRFVFTDEIARTVCVHPAFIIESLRVIYPGGWIADELEGSSGSR